jgi:hypothetical protein
MKKKIQLAQQRWGGRKRDSQLFTSTMQQTIPNILSVHMPFKVIHYDLS